jgi:hypothetical protein
MGASKENVMTTVDTCLAQFAADINKARQSLDILETRLSSFGSADFRNDVCSFWMDIDCMAELASDLHEDSSYHNAHHLFSHDAKSMILADLDGPIDEHRAKFAVQLVNARTVLSALERAVSDRDTGQINQQALTVLKLASHMDEAAQAIALLQSHTVSEIRESYRDQFGLTIEAGA